MNDNICPWCEGDRSHVNLTHESCPERDLIAEASVTGRIHAERGRPSVAEQCERVYGPRAARAYEAGYQREMARAAGAAA